MNTSNIPPEYPQGGGISSDDLTKQGSFYAGEKVLMRSRRLSKEEVKRFYDLYASSLPLEVWWKYLGKDYNTQIEYCKDADDDGGFYMFHTKYIGTVKERLDVKKKDIDLFGQRVYIVEWEAREGTLFPGESATRQQEHYSENLISFSKMTVVTKEEIVQDVLNWSIQNHNWGTTQFSSI